MEATKYPKRDKSADFARELASLLETVGELDEPERESVGIGQEAAHFEECETLRIEPHVVEVRLPGGESFRVLVVRS